MASRLTGAVVALLAAVLLLSAVFSHGWWDGHPIVSGEVRHVQDVHVGPLGGELCNTGGDGACHQMPLVGGFKATGVIVAIVLGLLAAAVAALAVLVFLDSERKRSFGKVMFGGVGAGAIVSLALYIEGPTLNSTQQVIMPLGHGMLFFWFGAAFAVTAGVLARRVTQPIVLKSGPSWVPNPGGGMSPLDMMQGGPVAPASPGGPLPGLAGPLGAPGYGDPFAQFVAPPQPRLRPPSAQHAIPPSPQNPFGSPSAPVPVAYAGTPSQPHAAPFGVPTQQLGTNPPFYPPPASVSQAFGAEGGATVPQAPMFGSPSQQFGNEPSKTMQSAAPSMSQPFAAVAPPPPTPNPDRGDRPRTLPPPPGRAKSSSLPAPITPNPDRPRTGSIAPPSIMAPPRQPGSTIPPAPRPAGATQPPPPAATFGNGATVAAASAPPPSRPPARPAGATNPPPMRQPGSTIPPARSPGSTNPPPIGAPRSTGSTLPPLARPAGSTKPPPVGAPRSTGSTLPPLTKPAAAVAPPRNAPSPSKVPPLRGMVPLPDPEFRLPTSQDVAQPGLSDTSPDGDGNTDLNGQALEVGDHTSPSQMLDPGPEPTDRDRGSYTDVVPTVSDPDGGTDQTAPAPESRSPSARVSAAFPSRSAEAFAQTQLANVKNLPRPPGPAATDKVPTLAEPSPVAASGSHSIIRAPITVESAAQPPLSTAPHSLPPPSAQQAAVSGPSPACPQCEAPMAWVEEHLRFYCKSCKMYF